MNRRNFLGLAVAAALAPVAFMREQGPYIGYDVLKVEPVGSIVSPSTYTWWRNPVYFKGKRLVWDDEAHLIKEMERLYIECLRNPAPPNLIVRRGT